jgi:hypothetical protein
MPYLTSSEDADTPATPATQALPVGRVVHYRLSAGDIGEIDRNTPQRDGDGRVVRNAVRVGQVYPAQVVAVFGSATVANLVVQLDGTATHWTTSRSCGDGEGQWSWPERM